MSLVETAGVGGPTPAGLTRLDDHPFHQAAPVGETQFPECPHLERVLPARCQVVDWGWRFRAGNHHRCPIDSGSCSRNRRVAEFVASGLRDSMDRYQKLPGIALIDPSY